MKVHEHVTIAGVRKGLPTEVFNRLASSLDMSQLGLGESLRIPRRTLDRRLREGSFSPEESDRLARVAAILNRARQVFRDPVVARKWMVTPLVAFDGESPIERADTSLGAMQVEDVLGRIEYGVYS
jgi:putative toxin-antitoxin system antitoxin component (TIGR02293 family)